MTMHPPALQPESRSRSWSLLRNWGRDVLISLGLSAFFIIFLYQPVRVEGTSMLPGLQDQERIFVNKFVYDFEPISRGDIVVFRYPRDPSKSYIKRVVAVGGDRIKIVQGQLYLNGRAVEEPYVPPQYEDYRSVSELVVPKGSFYVLGDHRSMSSDSRDFGAVPETLVTGKAIFVYWPLVRLGVLH